MTTIAANPNAAAFALGFQTATTLIAAGITAQFMRPLGAGPLAFAMLPMFFNVRCGQMAPCCPPQCPVMPEPAATWTTQMTGKHTASIDLGDGYKLEIDERNSEMWIINEDTGQRTRVWGDPHVDVNGKRQFDFWGTTTFTLDNGTKITINTEPWKGNANAYVASQVVITKGSNAIIVDGISQNQLGDLSVSMSNNGYAVDAAHRDGWTIHEGDNGWETGCGKLVDQNDANITAIGGLHGPGSTMPSLDEVASLLSGFLLLGILSSMMPVEPIGREGNREVARTFRRMLLA